MFFTVLPGQGTALLQQLQRINVVLLGMIITPGRRQSARASNRNIVVGNLAAVTTGAQDASPINVGP